MLEMEEAAAKQAGGDATLAPRLSSSIQWCPPPKPQLFLISWGTITSFLMLWLLPLVQHQPPDPVPPEVSALLGGIDEDAELRADVQPAASDGHSGASSLRAIQGSYGLHHGKLKTEGKSVF